MTSLHQNYSALKTDKGIWLRAILLSLIFSLLYLYAASMSPNSIISRQAAFNVDIPFKYRFLIPCTLDLFLTDKVMDSRLARTLALMAFLVPCFWLIQRYATRIRGTELSPSETATLHASFFLLLLAHYCLPRELNVYYIYDIPAIFFYMTCFLLLTRTPAKISWYAAALTVLASLNRETVMIAVIHAAAFHLCTEQPRRQTIKQTIKKSVWVHLALIAAAIVVTRITINQLLGASISSNATPMEGENIRFWANMERIAHNKHHTTQLLMLGCGAILWMPIAFLRFPHKLKWIWAASVPPLVVFAWAGNITELRMYNEFLPCLAVSLWLFLSYQAPQIPRNGGPKHPSNG